jgi:hypothetical protein
LALMNLAIKKDELAADSADLAAVAFYYATPDVRSVMIMQIFNMAALYATRY